MRHSREQVHEHEHYRSASIYRQHDVNKAVIHWYSGSLATFERLADRGAYFTVGVEVLYSEHIRQIAREVPLCQLLPETDNPGGPRDFLGQSGMPVLIKDVVRKIAEVRGSSYDEVVRQMQENFLQLIRGDSRLAQIAVRIRRQRAGGTEQSLPADGEDAAAEG